MRSGRYEFEAENGLMVVSMFVMAVPASCKMAFA